MARKEKKYHYIYKTTCIVNGKYYVGMHSSDNLEDGYMGSGKRLRRSLNRYGKENFKIEILEFLPNRNSLIEREKELVNEELLKDSLTMNLKLGGEGGFINIEHKENFHKGASNFQKNRWVIDEQYRNKITEIFKESTKLRHKLGLINYRTFTGKKHSEESKIKISESGKLKMGEKNSQFGTCWITNGKENKKIKKEEIIPDGWKLGRKI